jgi:hypothetical protein
LLNASLRLSSVVDQDRFPMKQRYSSTSAITRTDKQICTHISRKLALPGEITEEPVKVTGTLYSKLFKSPLLIILWQKNKKSSNKSLHCDIYFRRKGFPRFNFSEKQSVFYKQKNNFLLIKAEEAAYSL